MLPAQPPRELSVFPISFVSTFLPPPPRPSGRATAVAPRLLRGCIFYVCLFLTGYWRHLGHSHSPVQSPRSARIAVVCSTPPLPAQSQIPDEVDFAFGSLSRAYPTQVWRERIHRALPHCKHMSCTPDTPSSALQKLNGVVLEIGAHRNSVTLAPN